MHHQNKTPFFHALYNLFQQLIIHKPAKNVQIIIKLNFAVIFQILLNVLYVLQIFGFLPNSDCVQEMGLVVESSNRPAPLGKEYRVSAAAATNVQGFFLFIIW
jgi:hypothetical protein